MRLLLSLMCLVFGTCVCTCTHLGINQEGNDELADSYEENTNQEEEAYENLDDDGYDDDDDDDEDQENEDLSSNNLATGLMVQPPVTLSSGDTVTIQVVNRMRLHLGCFTGKCGAQSCPGMYFDPEDYTKCVGEVFQIYRAAGPGKVTVGENVGFYFPHKRQWLRAAGGSQTDLIACPGVPRNVHYRLNTRCYGEVFQVYVRGKSVGQPIDVLDHVMIYYPRSKVFLKYRHDKAAHNGLIRDSCPGQCLPPQPSAYERCYRDVFAISKKR